MRKSIAKAALGARREMFAPTYRQHSSCTHSGHRAFAIGQRRRLTDDRRFAAELDAARICQDMGRARAHILVRNLRTTSLKQAKHMSKSSELKTRQQSLTRISWRARALLNLQSEAFLRIALDGNLPIDVAKTKSNSGENKS